MSDASVNNRQRTLGGQARIAGTGLFSGKTVNATLKPADVNQGVIFRRTDLPGSAPIPAMIANVIERPRRTALQVGDAVVEMIEHCLSALTGMGVDNAIVELDAEELPAGDGSASLFVDAIRAAGVIEQQALRNPIILTEPIVVSANGASILATPAPTPCTHFVYELDYGEQSPIKKQTCAFTLDPDAYAERIAPARTYTLFEEAQAMRSRGLFQHLSPASMLVIGDDGPIDNALRFEDEPARHKLLDLLGDLALVGRPLCASVQATRSGHALNHELARRLVAAAAE